MMQWQWLWMFGSILLLDLVLSGDNALVLGAAIARLPRRQRVFALLWGGAGAILLRIALSSVASLILNIPWIQTIGALILFWIAVRLLAERGRPQAHAVEELQSNTLTKKLRLGQENFKAAALTIFIADITMSLDNILAVGAIANGAFIPMAIGLLISIVIILCGSALIAELMARFSWLLDAAALVLAWTGGTMIRDDLSTMPLFKPYLSAWSAYAIPLACVVCMVCVLLYFYIHERTISRSANGVATAAYKPAARPSRDRVGQPVYKRAASTAAVAYTPAAYRKRSAKQRHRSITRRPSSAGELPSKPPHSTQRS